MAPDLVRGLTAIRLLGRRLLEGCGGGVGEQAGEVEGGGVEVGSQEQLVRDERGPLQHGDHLVDRRVRDRPTTPGNPGREPGPGLFQQPA